MCRGHLRAGGTHLRPVTSLRENAREIQNPITGCLLHVITHGEQPWSTRLMRTHTHTQACVYNCGFAGRDSASLFSLQINSAKCLAQVHVQSLTNQPRKTSLNECFNVNRCRLTGMNIHEEEVVTYLYIHEERRETPPTLSPPYQNPLNVIH